MIKIIHIVIAVINIKPCKPSISADLKNIKLICLPKPDNMRDHRNSPIKQERLLSLKACLVEESGQ